MAGSDLDVGTATILSTIIDLWTGYVDTAVDPAIKGLHSLRSEMKHEFWGGPADCFDMRMTAVETNLKALRELLGDAVEVVKQEATAASR